MPVGMPESISLAPSDEIGNPLAQKPGHCDNESDMKGGF